MFCEVECQVYVRIPTENLDRNYLVPQRTILSCLLKSMLIWKATKEHGYFLAVTKLKSIGKGEFEESSRSIFFPVAFFFRTFLPANGEIMHGVVNVVHRRGVFLKCGPIKYVYLSVRKMPNYYYVGGENPHFIKDDLSRIEKDVVILFTVFAVRWTKKRGEIEREFMILASLEGNGLGPVSMAGYEELDL
ncbi:DNA-directed RNA polymerase V subunit 7-like [Cornus florida]|uniref:DNA-directed RNA polymerase V subunit 7-like n=1 Tax=Cornus florida TaxID=4283 RepID=UPI002897A32C|nr:DNA-directed RNA polymerase V subunit 7-like [Cornus florida]